MKTSMLNFEDQTRSTKILKAGQVYKVGIYQRTIHTPPEQDLGFAQSINGIQYIVRNVHFIYEIGKPYVILEKLLLATAL